MRQTRHVGAGGISGSQGMSTPRGTLRSFKAFSSPPSAPPSTTTTTSSSTLSTGSTGSTGDRALNVELWRSLVIATGDMMAKNVEEAQNAMRTGVVRLQRLTEPPPADYPPGPSGDQAVNLISDPLNFLTKLSKEYGGVVGLLMGGERVVLVTGEEAAKKVMVDRADIFIKEGTAFFPGSSLAGNGLLVSDGDLWKRQRRLSNPAFRKAAVDSYAEAMVTATEAMVNEQWASGGVRDVYADFNELTLRVTLEALFGFSSSGRSTASKAEEIVAAVALAFEYFTRRAGTAMVIPEWLPTMDNLEFSAAVARLDRVVYSLMDERRAELKMGGEGAPERKDLMNALITSVDEDGKGMSNQALRDEMMTLLVAGQETSAILLGWTAALLAHNPEVQERAAQEVAAATDGCTRLPGAAEVRAMKLQYTEAVILEALRMYAPAYMVGRCACEDVMLGEYKLAKGTTVLISPYVMHRDERYWEDPNTFNPDRWTSIQESENYKGFIGLMSNLGPNGMYVPFGAGPRNCIGTGFAMMEGITVLAALLQKYKLVRPSPTATFPKPAPMITLRPEAVPIKLERRG